MRSARGFQRSAAGLTAAVLCLSLAPAGTATADPSASDWHRLRLCESSDNYSIDTGNDHYGAYQFDRATWRSVGGSGNPSHASPGEQDARALILYRLRGWQPWQCAQILGLVEDADARSGVIADIRVPTSSTSAPDWPGTRYYQVGDDNSTVARWKAQMRTRGAPGLHNDGRFGAGTRKVVRRVQHQNGLPRTGVLGPVTWALAWTGDYRPPASTSHSTGHGSGPVASAPAMPGPAWFSRGDDSTTIERWQSQMHRRGSSIHVNGHFGRKTLRVVKRIQRLNGLDATGILGPVTWALAWTGAYR